MYFQETGYDMCIHIVIFVIANKQIVPISDGVICPPHVRTFISWRYLSKYQQSFTKLATCIDIVEIWFGIANGKKFGQRYLPATQ